MFASLLALLWLAACTSSPSSPLTPADHLFFLDWDQGDPPSPTLNELTRAGVSRHPLLAPLDAMRFVKIEGDDLVLCGGEWHVREPCFTWSSNARPEPFARPTDRSHLEHGTGKVTPPVGPVFTVEPGVLGKWRGVQSFDGVRQHVGMRVRKSTGFDVFEAGGKLLNRVDVDVFSYVLLHEATARYVVTEGNVLRTFTAGGEVRTIGHRVDAEFIELLAFAPDGRRIALLSDRGVAAKKRLGRVTGERRDRRLWIVDLESGVWSLSSEPQGLYTGAPRTWGWITR